MDARQPESAKPRDPVLRRIAAKAATTLAGSSYWVATRGWVLTRGDRLLKIGEGMLQATRFERLIVLGKAAQTAGSAVADTLGALVAKLHALDNSKLGVVRRVNWTAGKFLAMGALYSVYSKGGEALEAKSGKKSRIIFEAMFPLFGDLELLKAILPDAGISPQAAAEAIQKEGVEPAQAALSAINDAKTTTNAVGDQIKTHGTGTQVPGGTPPTRQRNAGPLDNPIHPDPKSGPTGNLVNDIRLLTENAREAALRGDWKEADQAIAAAQACRRFAQEEAEIRKLELTYREVIQDLQAERQRRGGVRVYVPDYQGGYAIPNAPRPNSLLAEAEIAGCRRPANRKGQVPARA